MEIKKRYTIYDVAKYANVSPSTVSHVLNGTATISVETQERIRAAIRELNYRPNANARALRQPHSHILGVTFPDIASEYYAACTASIIQHAQRHKYVVLASDLHFDNKVLAASIPALVERRVDGLIFIGGTKDEVYLRMAVEAGVPVVLGDRFMEGFPTTSKPCETWYARFMMRAFDALVTRESHQSSSRTWSAVLAVFRAVCVSRMSRRKTVRF